MTKRDSELQYLYYYFKSEKSVTSGTTLDDIYKQLLYNLQFNSFAEMGKPFYMSKLSTYTYNTAVVKVVSNNL